MNKIVILILMVLWGTGCHEVTVGYLYTEDASYSVNTMEIKTYESLDATPGEINPAVEERVLLYGYTLEMCYSWGMSFEDIANNFGLPARLNVGVDYQRVSLNLPWVSNPIEGIQGTHVIYVSVKDVKTNDGDAGKMKEQLSVYGDGVLEIPLQHTVPVGTYSISLNFSNEGYSKDVNDCFTIVVK